MLIPRRIVLAILLATMSAVSFAEGRDDDRTWLIKTFDDMAADLMRVSATRPASNDLGRIAWGDSYTLSALTEMLAATGDPRYADMFIQLARFFENRIRVEADGALTWEYRPPLDGPGTEFEDVSHGSINADFLVLCYEHGIVFNKQDIAGLEKTLLTRVIRPDGSIAGNVGGTGKVNEHKVQALRWAGLARHSEVVRRRLIELRRAGSVGGAGTDMLGCGLLVTASRRTATAPTGL